MCQVNLVRLQNGGGFNSDEGTITVRTVPSVQCSKIKKLSNSMSFVPTNLIAIWEKTN